MFGQTNDLQQAIDQVNNTDNTNSDAAASGPDFSAIQDQLGVPPMPPTDGAGVPPMPADASSPIAPVEPTPITPESAVAEDAASAGTDTPAADTPTDSPATPADTAAENAESVPVNIGDNSANAPDASAPTTDAPNADISAVDTPSIDTPASDSSSDTTPSAEQILVSDAETAGNSADDGDIAKIRENVLKDLMPLMDKVQGDPEQKFEIYKDAMETLHDKGLISGAYKQASQITDENKKAESLMDLMKAIDTLK